MRKQRLEQARVNFKTMGPLCANLSLKYKNDSGAQNKFSRVLRKNYKRKELPVEGLNHKSEDLVENLVDLTQCSEEKIHIPGSIQPHGVLLALTEPDLSIVQASESASAVFGIARQELIGQPLQLLIGQQEHRNLANQIATNTFLHLNPLKLHVHCRPNPKHFNAVLHRSEGLLILEFETASVDEPELALEFFRTSNEALIHLLAASSTQELLQLAASFVGKLTGFDRIMIYTFDQEWNGSVQAEHKAEGMGSFLGLHFPASDIPPQARKLYERNYLRLLVDVDAKPSPILPVLNPLKGEPLDLSDSILRSMSPVHIEYLKNMNVAASMSMSLIRDGELRGLIACHHTTARHVDYRIRRACEFIARLVSLQMETIEERESYHKLVELKDARQDLLLHTSEQSNLASSLASSGKLLSVTGARGAAIVWDGQCILVGETPTELQVGKLVLNLSENLTGPVFSSNALSKYLPSAKEIASSASGLLAIRVSTIGPKWLLWFRPEQIKDVSWAGNPEKSTTVDADMRLRPRKSFEEWKEKVSGMSSPWLSLEIDNAMELRTALLDFSLSAAEKKRAVDLQLKVEELDALNKELESLSRQLQVARDAAIEASNRKSEMVSVVSHDLRAPLTSISGTLSMLKGGLYKLDSEKGAELINMALYGARYMLNLIVNLLDLDTLQSGKIDLVKAESSVGELINDAFKLVRSSADTADIELAAEVESATLLVDKDRIIQVLVNLISNAIKFSPAKTRIVVSSLSTEVETTIRVTDQGRGIPEEFRESIFERFKQVESDDRSKKGGSGLGLAICKTIVNAHGGTIGVDSGPGGSSFWFKLPKNTNAILPTQQKTSTAVTLKSQELGLEFDVLRKEFIQATLFHTAKLKDIATELRLTNAKLDDRKKHTATMASDREKSALNALLMQREYFVSALHELKTPLVGGTKILEHIAHGKVAPERHPEAIAEVIESNKNILKGTEQLAHVAQELSRRTYALQESNQNLADRTLKLEEANADLICLMQQREDFVAALTHDLKNPLLGGTRILEHIVSGAVTQEEQTRVLNQVIESNKSMLRMIWNMLETYKSETGSLQVNRSEFDFTVLLQESLDELSFATKEKEIELNIHIHDGLPLINTDRILLRRVLINLLDNAIKFTLAGGKLNVQVGLIEKSVTISIEDSGTGMTEEQIGQVFNRFWQSEKGRAYGIGTGLGLFSSKQIIEALGGDIKCTSTENVGTKFTITLDIQPNKATA
ncbi:MAG: hypothetical protein C0469_01660 [Cyanobacteria bacterium DS2.3.42]|nr:hypothetical protein [Cyanobacteria bacterium DS2.3.42]